MKLKYDSFNNMPLRVYNEIVKLKDSDKDAIDFEIALIALLCDVPETDILDLPVLEYQELLKETSYISEFPNLDNVPIPDKVIINGITYIVQKDIKSITTAQYIDFQNYLKMDNAVHYQLSCFLIPEGKKYGVGYNHNDVIKNVLDLDVVTALSVCFFFINLFLTSIETILNYLVLKTKREVKKIKNKEVKKKMMETLNLIRSIQSGDGL